MKKELYWMTIDAFAGLFININKTHGTKKKTKKGNTVYK
jgi:hypothetical protein